MTYKIEKGIPIPPARRTGGKQPNSMSAVMRELKVGESVFFPNTTQQKASKLALGVLGKGNYACRAEADGARVWRTVWRTR